MYTEANEAPLEERRFKLFMHYYLKTCACIDNPANHAPHEFDWTTWDLYVPRPNGRGGMTRPPAPPVSLKVEAVMASAEINARPICPLQTTYFPPGTQNYNAKKHSLIDGVKANVWFPDKKSRLSYMRIVKHKDHMMKSTLMALKLMKVWAAAVINRHFQNVETTSRQLSKRLPDNSTIFAAEATAISFALNYYRYMGPVHHNVVVYSDSMSCLQAIESEDTEIPLIFHGNERVDELTKETFDHDKEPLASIHYANMKPLVNSHVQQLVQTK